MTISEVQTREVNAVDAQFTRVFFGSFLHLSVTEDAVLLEEGVLESLAGFENVAVKRVSATRQPAKATRGRLLLVLGTDRRAWT